MCVRERQRHSTDLTPTRPVFTLYKGGKKCEEKKALLRISIHPALHCTPTTTPTIREREREKAGIEGGL